MKFYDRHRKFLIEAISALFILLFAYTALNKSFNINGTAIVIKRTTFLKDLSEGIAWGIVALEYLISIFLLIPSLRKVGLYGSVLLMATFTVYISAMLISKSKLPCSCGGVISSLSWTQHLILNILLTLLAILGVGLYKRRG